MQFWSGPGNLFLAGIASAPVKSNVCGWEFGLLLHSHNLIQYDRQLKLTLVFGKMGNFRMLLSVRKQYVQKWWEFLGVWESSQMPELMKWCLIGQSRKSEMSLGEAEWGHWEVWYLPRPQTFLELILGSTLTQLTESLKIHHICWKVTVVSWGYSKCSLLTNCKKKFVKLKGLFTQKLKFYHL